MKTIPLFVIALVMTGALCSAVERPNIVVILSDDAGFEEFGIYGVKKEVSNTPNIDKLGRNGVTFAHCWGQAICGPSRSMFITGNYGIHNGAYDNSLHFLPGQGSDIGINTERLPHFTRLVHDAGYKVAVAGKWHNPAGLMVLEKPRQLGLDSYCVWDAAPDPFEKRLGKELIPDETWEIANRTRKHVIPRYWNPGIIQDEKVLETTMDDFGPEVFTDFLCDFMEEQVRDGIPFLVYYTDPLPHGPHCVTPDMVADGEIPSNTNYPKKTARGKEIFRKQLNYSDKMVGKLVEKVHSLGITGNTVFIYASDNGTVDSSKGRAVEYGVHVPFIVSGAGIQQRGITKELTDFTDVLPTIVDFAGAEIPADRIDGLSLKPFLTGKTETTKPVIYSFPGIGRLVRTKEFMLEAVCPLYGQAGGRFYKTASSWDGRGYENITHHPEFSAERDRFQLLLEKYPTRLPDSWDNPVWKLESMQKGYNHYIDPKRKEKFLSLPEAYQFYDASF